LGITMSIRYSFVWIENIVDPDPLNPLESELNEWYGDPFNSIEEAEEVYDEEFGCSCVSWGAIIEWPSGKFVKDCWGNLIPGRDGRGAQVAPPVWGYRGRKWVWDENGNSREILKYKYEVFCNDSFSTDSISYLRPLFVSEELYDTPEEAKWAAIQKAKEAVQKYPYEKNRYMKIKEMWYWEVMDTAGKSIAEGYVSIDDLR